MPPVLHDENCQDDWLKLRGPVSRDEPGTLLTTLDDLRARLAGASRVVWAYAGQWFMRRRRNKPVVFQPIKLDRRIEGLSGPLNGHRLRRAGFQLLLGFVAMTTIVLARFWWLSTLAPQWWNGAGLLPIDSIRRAEAVERGLTTVLYRDAAGGGAKTVELRSIDANSWLTQRLPKWLANRGDTWPGGVSTPRVRFGQNIITIGVEVLSDNPAQQGRVVSIAFQPILDETGSLRLVGADTRVGQAPLGGVAAELAGMLGSPSNVKGTPLEALIEAGGGMVLREIVQGVRPAMNPALIDLDDGRAVRLLSLSVGEGRVRVMYSTETTVGTKVVDARVRDGG